MTLGIAGAPLDAVDEGRILARLNSARKRFFQVPLPLSTKLVPARQLAAMLDAATASGFGDIVA